MTALFTRERRQAEREQAADRRDTPRQRVLLSGKIAYGSGFSVDCSIRDISRGGACVSLPKNQGAPQELNLVVIRDGVVHKARTAWTRLPMIGLAFEETHDFAQPTPAHLKPLRALWTELAGRQ
jgi:hypothetical protein